MEVGDIWEDPWGSLRSHFGGGSGEILALESSVWDGGRGK